MFRRLLVVVVLFAFSVAAIRTNFRNQIPVFNALYEREELWRYATDGPQHSRSHFSAVSKKFEACVSRGKLPCSVNCSQGKVHYPSGCCQCICKKNFVLRNERLCYKASWSKWSAWSKCLKTSWGGLQRRERICKSRGKQAPGSCSGKGSKSRTCAAITKDFRIRKNLRDLTDEEFHDLIQAMTKFKKDRSKKGYRNIISWHGWPGRCPWYRNIEGHEDNHCSWHHHPLFLPWHRLIVVQLELGLSRYLKNKTLGIPFWDWTEHSHDIPYILRNARIYDPILKKYVFNPFHSTFIRYVHGKKIYTQRRPWYPGILMDKYLLKGSIRALLSHNYYTFDDQEATNPHDQIHDCFCVSEVGIAAGSLLCDYGMPTVDYAAFDPAFLLHHSAIDRMFAMRWRLEETGGVSDWTKSRVVGEYLKATRNSYVDYTKAFDWPLSPFCNKSMNPESVTGKRGIWTMHNGYYYEQLFGYKFTDFNFGHNYTWHDLQKDYKRNVIQQSYWNDEYFDTKVGPITKKNAYSLKVFQGCVMKYSNPRWNITVAF